MACFSGRNDGHVTRNFFSRPISHLVVEIGRDRFGPKLLLVFPSSFSGFLSTFACLLCLRVRICPTRYILVLPASPSSPLCSLPLSLSRSLPTLPGDGHRREQGGAPRPSSPNESHCPHPHPPPPRAGQPSAAGSPRWALAGRDSAPGLRHGAARRRQRWLSQATTRRVGAPPVAAGVAAFPAPPPLVRVHSCATGNPSCPC